MKRVEHRGPSPDSPATLRALREDAAPYALALRPGTLVGGRYRLTKVLGGSNPVAITYRATDERARQLVVVKELLPRVAVGRGPDGTTVRPHSGEDENRFARTLRRFVHEGELLSDITHPNIPRVCHHFTASGTAYLVFEHREGRTAEELAVRGGGRLSVDEAVRFVVKVLDAVQALHAEGIVHGAVSSDNVLVADDGSVLLLGLGTSLRVVGSAKEPHTGYAPIEVYGSKDLGPWTDVYACAAVLLRLLSGTAPPSAFERATGQPVLLPRVLTADYVALSRVVMAGLSQLPDGRPRSAEEFRRRVEVALGVGGVDRAPSPSQAADESPWAAAPEPERPVAATDTPPLLLPEVSVLDEDDEDLDRATVGERWQFANPLVRLGAAAALAVMLLAFTLVDGRGDDQWSGGDITEPPGPSATSSSAARPSAPLAPLRTKLTAIPAGTLRQTVTDSSTRPTRDSEPSHRRGVTTQENNLARSSPRAARTQSDADGADQGASIEISPIAVPAVPTLNQSAQLPMEVVADLRERLSHATERARAGAYASARRMLAETMDSIAALSGRYSESQSISALKHELEQAATRVLASCTAENLIRRKRNSPPLACE